MQQQKLRMGFMLTVTLVIAHFTACFWAFVGLMSKDETDPTSVVCTPAGHAPSAPSSSVELRGGTDDGATCTCVH
jgi:hypothetical protein